MDKWGFSLECKTGLNIENQSVLKKENHRLLGFKSYKCYEKSVRCGMSGILLWFPMFFHEVPLTPLLIHIVCQ